MLSHALQHSINIMMFSFDIFFIDGLEQDSPLLTHWSYRSLTLSRRYNLTDGKLMKSLKYTLKFAICLYSWDDNCNHK